MAGSKTQRIVGWVLSGLLAAFLIGGSVMGKFLEWEGKEEMFEKLGLTTDLVKNGRSRISRWPPR